MRWLLIFATWLQGAAVITLDTQANAKLATSNANESTMIAKLQESLRLYNQLITHAQAKLTKLQQLQALLERAQEFTHARTLPPQDSTLASLKEQIARLQKRQNHLKTAMQRHNTLIESKRARLEKQCPWLDFKRGVITQPSSQQAQQAQAFLEDLLEHSPRLSGAILATLLCEHSLQAHAQSAQQSQIQAMQSALLEGDFKAYRSLAQQHARAQKALRHKQAQHAQSALAALAKRQAQMRQFLSPSALQGRLEALNNTLLTQLLEAKTPNAQARAYSHYHQQAQALQLELLLELTRQLHFLNETIAMDSAFKPPYDLGAP
ncbi:MULTISPECIES: hypothetical protein [Helicobacter]|uniref:hypothetical protein n=1 Tax=Helicobacter TaxID=209 RepID=UPI000EB42907|nr:MULTISPECIES: hypothetical protein [Helicobacter]